MKNYIIIGLIFLIISSCTYRPKDKILTDLNNNDKNIIKSFYKIQNDTIEFGRISTNGTELLYQKGRIYNNKSFLTEQILDFSQKLSDEEYIIDSLSKQLSEIGFSSNEGLQESIMFIQIVPDSGMSNIDALKFMRLRHKVETKIDNDLQLFGQGQWVAGDLGAGANILFTIKNWEVGFKIAFKILETQGLIDHVLITKRIMTAENDWNYEIVYPIEYEGVFNSM